MVLRLQPTALAATLLVATFPAEAAGIRVAGTVAGPEGRALEQARVELAPVPSNHGWGHGVLAGAAVPEPVRATVTDRAGRFVLEAPGAGVWTVVVRAEGFVPMRLAPLPLVEPTVLPPVLLPRDAGAEVEVRGGGGAPQAEVWISAETASEPLWRDLALEGWRPAARITRSDGRGRASLPRLEGERLRILAVLPGSLAQGRAEGLERTVLTVGSKSSCRALEVRSDGGHPLAEVLVAFGETAWPVGTTDREGRLGLCGAISEPVDLHLFGSGGGRQRRRLEPGGPDGAPVMVSLALPARISGRVLGSGRRPLAAALVWPAEDPGRFVSTDPAGSYRIEVTPGPGARLQAAAPGYLRQALPVRLAAENETRAPTMALEPDAPVAGQVVDRKGDSAAGVLVEALALPPARGGSGSRAISDGEGRFTLRGLRLQGTYEVTALRDGFSPTTVTLEVAALGRQGIRLVLDPAHPAHGKVTDSAGQPIADAEVKLLPAGSAAPRRALATAETDGTGRFVLPFLPVPRFGLVVSSPGFAPLSVPGVQGTQGEGPVDLGTLVLRPGSTLTGRVTDTRGRPLPEAGVWVLAGDAPAAESMVTQARREPPRTVTDGAGRFRIEELAHGRRIHLAVHCPGYLSRLVPEVEPPAPAPLQVVLEPAARVAGELVEEGSARPVARARVTLRDQGPPPGTVGVRPPGAGSSVVTSDEQGRFVIEEVAPGRFELEAVAEGFVRPAPVQLDVPAGGKVEGVRLTLRRGATVQGRVKRADGEPVMGTRLRIGEEEATSDVDGFYRLTGIEPGYRALEALHPELERLVRGLDVVPGVNQEDLVLTGGWRVSGRVVDERGEPVVGVRVGLRSEAVLRRRQYEVFSRDDGRFDFPGVVAGTYEVQAMRAGYAGMEEPQRLQVTEGVPDELEIVLRRGAAVSGRLLGLEPEDLAAVQIEASQGERARQAGVIDSAGGYEIADLGPGVWSIRARAQGGARQAEANVTIEPGARRLTRDLDFGGALTLRGRVSYERVPLPATSVGVLGLDRAVSRSVKTDHLGTFRVEDLEPGRYRISVAHRREMIIHNEEIELLADRDLEIEIATARLQGTVLSSATSQPIPDALVSVLQVLGPEGSPASVITVATDSEGAFTLARLAAGTYRIGVRRNGYEPVERLLAVEPGATQDLELALSPAEGLDLAVRLASGRIPKTVTLNVLEPSGKPILTETQLAAADHLHRFQTVPAGRWTLVVSAPETVPAWRSVEVPCPRLEVVLDEDARIEVRVPDLIEENRVATLTVRAPDGRPFVGVGRDGRLEREWTLSGGLGAVEGLPAGAWTLEVQAGQRAWQQTVTVAAGASLIVTLP